MFCWNKFNIRRALVSLIADLVVLSTFLYAGQPDDRLTVLQSLVENGVGVTLDLFFLPLWSFVVLLHLFSLDVLHSLEAERETGVICILFDKHQIFVHLFETVSSICFLTCARISRAKTLFPCSIIMLMNLLKSKDKQWSPDVNSGMLNMWHPSCSELGCAFSFLPEVWVAEHGAGDSTGRCLDGSECFELPLLLLLSTQLWLRYAVGLLTDLRLQIVRVVSAPSHQEHSANRGHKRGQAPKLLQSLCVWGQDL